MGFEDIAFQMKWLQSIWILQFHQQITELSCFDCRNYMDWRPFTVQEVSTCLVVAGRHHRIFGVEKDPIQFGLSIV